MATTINAANLSIGLDIEKLKTGMNATRAEMNSLKSMLKASVPETQTLREKIDLLSRAYRTGAIDAQAYNRTMQSLTRHLREASAYKGGGNAGGLLGQFAGGMAPMLALGGIGMAVDRIASSFLDTAKAIDETQKQAFSLGMSFSDLTVAQRLFGDTAGVGAEATGEALKKMQINLVKARDGSGDLAKSLKQIGLDAKQLSNLAPLDAFKAIAAEFNKIENSAERTKFAVDLFGKSGGLLVGALADGAKSADAMEQHLRSSGMLLSDEAVKAVEMMNDQMGLFNDHIVGAANSITGRLAPAIAAAMTDVNKGLDAAGSTGIGPGRLIEGFLDYQTLGLYSAYAKKGQEAAAAAVEEAKSKSAAKAISEEELEAAEAKRKEAERLTKSYEDQKKALEYQLDVLNLGAEAAAKKASLEKLGASGLDSTQKFNILQKMKELQELEDAKKESNKIRDQFNETTIREKRENENKIRNLEAEQKGLLGSGDQNVAATIAPAIQAGTVEAYKFLNQQNEQKLARQEQKERLDVIAGELKKLNEKQFATLERKR
jgi:hypothetical protein